MHSRHTDEKSRLLLTYNTVPEYARQHKEENNKELFESKHGTFGKKVPLNNLVLHDTVKSEAIEISPSTLIPARPLLRFDVADFMTGSF